MSKLRKLAGFGLSRQNANTERQQSQLLFGSGPAVRCEIGGGGCSGWDGTHASGVPEA